MHNQCINPLKLGETGLVNLEQLYFPEVVGVGYPLELVISTWRDIVFFSNKLQYKYVAFCCLEFAFSKIW